MTMPDATPTPPSVMEEALAYASIGLRVIPIMPGDKRPPMKSWQHAASVDAAVITNWFTGLYRTCGVGIATGATSRGDWLFVLDVDDHGNGVSGSDTLHDLEKTHGTLPDTAEVATGSGGRHLYFLAPFEIRNDAGNKLGPGLDIRGEGGQVVAPPTIHPSGNRYEWVIDRSIHDTEIAYAPDWLLDMLAPVAPPTPAPTPTPAPRDEFLAGTSIADRFNAASTWEDILTRDGWTLAHVDQNGEHHWTRPGKKTDDGTSATTNYQGKDILHVFTSSVPWLNAEGNYSRFAYVAARDHAGDMSAFARHLVSENGTQLPQIDETDSDDPDTWDDINLEGWLNGTIEAVEPAILARTDHQALLYAGRINMIFGESGSGKSWVALAAATQLIAEHRHVAYIDLEDHPGSMLARLTALGARKADIITYFHYKRPDTAGYLRAVEAIQELRDQVDLDLVIVDSYGEALALFGVDQNDDKGVAGFTQSVLRPWTRMGVAVALLDHIPKAEDGPKLFAIGSQRKRAAVDGAAYRINQVRAFGKGVDGKINVVCAKDRGGTFPVGYTVAEIDVHSLDGGERIRLDINPPEARDSQGNTKRPTGLMESVSRYLEKLVDYASQSDIRANIKSKATYVDTATRCLVKEGFVATQDVVFANRKKGVGYISIRPFRESPDAENVLSNFTAVPAVPQPSHSAGRLSEGPTRDSRPSRPDYKEIVGRGTPVEGIGGPQPSHSRPESESTQNPPQPTVSIEDLWDF